MMDGLLEIVGKFINYIGKNIGMFLLMCAVSYVTYAITMFNVNVEVERLEDYVDKTAKHTMKQIQYTKQDLEMLEYYVDIELGYKVDTTKLDEVVLDTAAINEILK